MMNPIGPGGNRPNVSVTHVKTETSMLKVKPFYGGYKTMQIAPRVVFMDIVVMFNNKTQP